MMNSAIAAPAGQNESPVVPRSRLNIKGLLDLDQMSAVITGLIEQVDKQNKVINDLNDRLSSFVRQNEFAERQSSLESLITKVSNKLDAVQQAATAFVMNKKIAAGDLATSNFETVTQLSTALMDCVTQADAQRQQAKIDKMDTAINMLQQRFDKLSSMSDQLSRSQLQQGNRISNAETSIAGKIDRSEMDHLRALVAKVETYDEFKVRTIHAVADMQEYQRQTAQELSGVAGHLKSIDGTIQNHNVEIARLATKKEQHMLAKEIAAQKYEIGTCAKKSELEQTQQAVNRAEGAIDRNKEQIDNLKAETERHGLVLQDKASVAAVKNCVSRKHYEQAVAALGSAVDSKTPLPTTEILEDRIQVLEGRIAEDEEQIKVAVRFVDWFSSRGENYEHNMKIIDKHLKSLLTTSPSDPVSKVHSYHLPNSRVIFEPAKNTYGGK